VLALLCRYDRMLNERLTMEPGREPAQRRARHSSTLTRPVAEASEPFFFSA
jgi:hypothetical protein